MADLPQHRLGWRALALAALFLLAIAVVLPGCGGGDDSTEATTVGQGTAQRPADEENDSTPRQGDGSVPVDDKASGQRRGHDEGARAKGGKDAQAKHGTAGDDRGSGGNGRDDGSQAPTRGSGRCPSNITREQCKAYAEQPVSDDPSYPAEDPADCAQAMSREACEEQFEAERSSKSGDASVSVDRCLEEHSRAQCEAQLTPQLEAEHAESKGN